MIAILGQIKLNMDSPFYVLQIVITLVAFMAALLIRLIIVIHVARVLISGGKRHLFIDEYAGLVATRKKIRGIVE